MFDGKSGQVVLDQIRTVDKERLLRPLGSLDRATSLRVLDTLSQLFGP